MIQEAISFAKKYEEDDFDETLSQEWKGKKFIIINTIKEGERIKYKNFETLDSDEVIVSWLQKNKYYGSILRNIDSYYILPSSINSALGSSSGLATYSFFGVRLSQAIIQSLKIEENKNKSFKSKVEKTKFNNENDSKININQIHEIYLSFKKDLDDKVKNDSEIDYMDFNDFYVLIKTDKDIFERWKEITDISINEKLALGSKNTSEGRCSICGHIKAVTFPNFLTSNDSSKVFLRHKTRVNSGSDELAFTICGDCGIKLTEFEKILDRYKIKIFPLFIEPEKINKEIRLMKKDKFGDEKNKFSFIFEQLEEETDKNEYTFYLVVMSKYDNYFFFDYVTGYKWRIGNFRYFFKDTPPKRISREEFESKFWKLLKGNRNQYFGDIKGKDNQEASLIHSMRQKLFYFVYRNRNSITSRDIRKMLIYKIEKQIKNNSVYLEGCKEDLELYLNKHLLEGEEMNENEVLLNKIEPKKTLLKKGKHSEFDISDGEEWAYWSGQVAYYLVSLSKSSNKTYGLLEPFTNKSTTKLVKMTIKDLFEKYRHEINLRNEKFKSIITKVLSYDIEKPFMDLKISFYIGAFDDNVMYQKKENKEDE